MRIVRVQSIKTQAQIADQCFVADSFFTRLRGWIGKSHVVTGEALLLRPCNDIHMWMMRFPIDVVFLREIREPSQASQGSQRSQHRDLKWVITSVHENVPAWKVLPLRDGKASDTLELPVGSIRKHGLQCGDELLCIN